MNEMLCMDEAILLEKPLHKATKFLHVSALCIFTLALLIFITSEEFFRWLPTEEYDVAPPVVKELNEGIQPISLDLFAKRPLKEMLFLPELVNSIHSYQRPQRPDVIEEGRYFSFANDPLSFLPLGSSCYLSLTSNGFSRVPEETPLLLSLSKDGLEASLTLKIVTSDNVEVLRARHTFSPNDFPNVVSNSHSKEFEDFCKKIEHLALYPPDVFFTIYGGKIYGKKGHNFRLGSLSSQVYPIDCGSIFTLQYDALVPLVKPKNAECPLFRVSSISSGRIEIEAWDSTGQEYARIPLIPVSPKGLDVLPEELFKDIRVKGGERAVVKIGKKTKMLHAGDYLLREGKSWKVLDEKDSFEGMLNYLNCGMLFVFEGIFQNGKETVFSGRLFDETRSAQKKVEIPVRVKKKQKMIRNRPEEMMRDGHDEIPPEIEELLEELDDL